MMVFVRWFAGLALVAGLFLLTGCGDSGPKRSRVYGTVSFKGQPIKSGQITFLVEGSHASVGGAPITDGKYDIPKAAGLPPGNYKVSISAGSGDPGVKEGEAPGVSGPSRETIPEKYNANTELRAEVKAGDKNEFNYDLQ